MGKSVLIGFKVDSLDEKMKSIKDRGIEIEGPYSPTPSTKIFYIKDPNGLAIQFREDVKL